MSPELYKSLQAWTTCVEDLLDHLRISEPRDIELFREIERHGNYIRRECPEAKAISPTDK